MRKFIFTAVFLGLSVSSFATWYNPVDVLQVRVTTGGRVFFQATGFNNTRWWTFDGRTEGGRNLLSTLLTARSAGMKLRFDGTTAYTGSDRPTTDTWNCAGMQL